MPQFGSSRRPSTQYGHRQSITWDLENNKNLEYADQEDYDSDDENEEQIRGRQLDCGWLPCCMSEEDAEAFGHHVSIFMVALVAFATFFCVTLILILVFLLG